MLPCPATPVTKQPRHNVSFVAVASRSWVSNFWAVSMDPSALECYIRSLESMDVQCPDQRFWLGWYRVDLGIILFKEPLSPDHDSNLQPVWNTTAFGRSEGNRELEDLVQSSGQSLWTGGEGFQFHTRNVQQTEVNWLIQDHTDSWDLAAGPSDSFYSHDIKRWAQSIYRCLYVSSLGP